MSAQRERAEEMCPQCGRPDVWNDICSHCGYIETPAKRAIAMSAGTQATWPEWRDTLPLAPDNVRVAERAVLRIFDGASSQLDYSVARDALAKLAQQAKAAYVTGWDANDVRRQLTDECALAGGQKAWAARHGVSPAYVSDVLSERREPGTSILEALRLKRVVTYRSLPPPPVSP